MADLGEEAFGVELDAFEGEPAMADAHELATVGGPGGALETVGEGVLLDGEGMVTGGGEGIGVFGSRGSSVSWVTSSCVTRVVSKGGVEEDWQAHYRNF